MFDSPPAKMQLYMDRDLIAAIDAWRVHQEGRPLRSDAIRRLCRRALKADTEKAVTMP
jgi:hypothetical protein